ncbi:MAG TPA: sensor histidine kinase [Ktedonobacteraceae bacterium]
MSDLPSTEEREAYIVDRLGSGLGYFTVIIGYLFTILTTKHLTLPDFLVFTVLQVCYSMLLWWMIRSVWQSSRVWRIVLAVVLLMGITAIVGLMPLVGLQWDWLLFLVTIAIFFSLLPLRIAIGTGSLLYALMMVNLFVIDDWNWSLVYPSLLTLLPAFAFVAVFSLTLHLQQVQGDRTERLLRQLEESNAELERAHRQLQEYADEVEELTIVRERTRVAREIHDTLGHHLSILNIQLETISKLQERDPARAAVEIAEARRVATQSMQEVRNAVAALRPASIATLSLPQAMTQLANEFGRSVEGIQITLDLETQFPLLAPDVQVAFYRATQEAFTNVRKHSQASKVLVRLRHEDESLELLVLDNGRGITHTEKESGFGLVGLRERFELLGGQVVYGQAEQGGFRVSVRAPVPAETRERKEDLPHAQKEKESQGIS